MFTKKLFLFLFFAFLFCEAIVVPRTNTTILTRACQAPLNTFPFCDTSLSITDRVNNLISLLEDEDIPAIMTARHNGGGSPGPPGNVSRIGLAEFDWGLNCLHGVGSTCVTDYDGTIRCPSSFPNPVNYGAAFNQSLSYDLGKYTAAEVRALWLIGSTEYLDWTNYPHIGLDCWSPNINVNRDPRWGRNPEVPSEDPYTNGVFGTFTTKGLQEGEDSRFIKVISTIKHWDAYSMEQSDGVSRLSFNVNVTNFTYQDTYFPAFKMSVQEGNAKGVMCSYVAVQGVPSCASRFLTTVLRDTWGFDGYVTSDTGALEFMYQYHNYIKTQVEAAAVAVTDGGVDICSGYSYYYDIINARNTGLITMNDVQKALFNSLRVRFELGLFDPIEDQPYWKVDPSVINSKESQEHNLFAALSSMVLLKNDLNTLPFTKGKMVAVIGPHSQSQVGLFGGINYLGGICPTDDYTCIETPYLAIQNQNKGGITVTAPGCAITGNDTSGFDYAFSIAQAADYVVLMLGIDSTIEGEGLDRPDIDLPPIQHQLSQLIMKEKKPTAVVLINGGMVSIAEEKATVPAILSAGYPSFYGGKAIAMTIFGDNDHLGGKLPYTIYPKEYADQIEMIEMEMDVGPGRSYRYYTGTPLYPFGFGLSYTTFSFLSSTSEQEQHQGPIRLKTENNVKNYQRAFVGVNVTNTGNVTGDDVVFFYMVPGKLEKQTQSRLIKQLYGFQRVHLAPGQSQIVQSEISQKVFNMVDKNTGDIVSTPGQFYILATNGVDQHVKFSYRLYGEELIVEKFPTIPPTESKSAKK